MAIIEYQLSDSRPSGLKTIGLSYLRIALLFFFLTAQSTNASEKYFEFVVGGEPRACIVLPKEPNAGEVKAAAELKQYVKQISGAELPLLWEKQILPFKNAISVGRTSIAGNAGILRQVASLPNDSFTVVCRPTQNVLILAGKGRLGPTYAVYSLLESEFGVHWYFPDHFGKVIPHSSDLHVGAIEITKSPDFPIRAIGTKKNVASWALFNGNNVNFADALRFRLYRHAHTFKIFCSPEMYYAGHPEYFALVKGKRRTKQLCTSNSEVVRTVSSNMIRLIQENPGMDMVTLFPNDGLGFCECGKCKALDEVGLPSVEEINSNWRKLGPKRYRALSRRMLIFYLAVSGRVLRKYPNVLIQVGAYNAYLYPPLDKAFKAPKNVLVQMCHGWDHNYSIESKASDINTRFSEALEGWRKIFSAFGIYEYYLKLAMFDLPFPILHSIKKDIPYFKRKGVLAFYTQFGSDYYTNGLNYYIASKLLWDTSQNVNELVAEFCSNFYGAAGKLMLEYYDNYEKAAIQTDMTLAPPIYNLERLFTKGLLARQKTILEKAKLLTKNKRALKRIHRTSLSLEYVEMCMEYLETARSAVQQGNSFQSMSGLKRKAEKIRSFREKHEGSFCFNRENNHIRRFLNTTWLVKQFQMQ